VRVVFDSNVLVAALVFPGGKADEALGRVIAGVDQLLVSTPIIQEVLGVLSRKFSRDREELARVAVYLADLGERVESTHHLNMLVDEPDNRILECAVSGKADAVVTGDQALLRPGQYGDVSIITLRAFLAG
jgi:putative PIN family toxin of toxin-antitoxin system